MRWFRRKAKKPTPKPTPVELVRRSGGSEMWRYSDGTCRCHCGYACLAAYEPCEFEQLRKWPTWPNGTPPGGCRR